MKERTVAFPNSSQHLILEVKSDKNNKTTQRKLKQYASSSINEERKRKSLQFIHFNFISKYLTSNINE